MESALYLPVSLYIPRRHRPRPPSATDQIHLCSGMETETEMKETLLPSKLPLELWSEIGKRLESRIDVACFRSVCRLWRSSLARPSRFPIRVPPPPGATSDINGIYLITEIETYNLFERRRMSIEGLDQPGKFRTVGCPPWDVFDVSRRDRYPLHLLAKSYRICFSYPGCCSSKKVSLRDKVFTIVTISSNANGRVAAEYARLSDISLVAHLVTGRLALLRLDNSDSGWDTSFCGNRIFVAIATYNGQLCAIDCFSRVFLMDYHSLQMTQVARTAVNEQLHTALSLRRKTHFACLF